MEENKRITVSIQGNKYTIKGNDSKEYINKIASQVNHIMEGLGKSNSLMNKNMISVLCSLNLADQLYHAQENIAHLEDKLIDFEMVPELKKELETVQHDSIFHLEKYKEAQRSITEISLELEKYQEMTENYKNKIKQNKIEIEAARQTIMDLQNQIFDNQIDIVKMKKELEEYRNNEIMGKKIYPYQKGKK